MAVDYLSTLNKSGSGINITELVGSLVTAETEPKKALIQKKLDETTATISEMATLKSTLSSLNDNLYAPTAGSGLSASSASSDISIEITDPFTATPFESDINITSLASAQVLAFSSFDSVAFTSKTDTLATSDDVLTIEFGTWESGTFTANSDVDSQTLSISASSSLSYLASALNDLDYVSARIVETTSGYYSLVVKSETGADYALNISSSNGSLADFETEDSDADGTVDSEIVAASDANFTVDGISMTRSSNVIDDIFDGVTVSLNEANSSSVKLSVLESSENALAEMKAFVDIINENRTYLKEATKRGLNGAASGPLAGNVTAATIKKYLNTLTINPIIGFDDNSFYLSDLGVQTNQDGSLSLDEDAFLTSFDDDPTAYRSVFQSVNKTGSSYFTASTSSNANLTSGAYDLDYDSASDTLTVDGVTFTTGSTSDGYTKYYDWSGSFPGLTLTAPANTSDVSTSLYIGESMIDTIRGYLATILSSTGYINDAEDLLTTKSAEYSEQASDLDIRAEVLRDKYLSQFAVMEQMVTRFNNTGTYLTNMMDSWSNQR